VLVIEDTLRRRKGNIIIPAFALGRTQEMLFLLADLRRQGRLPPMQVFVDSPMADRVTEITARHPEFLDDETRAVLSLRRAPPAGLSCASRRASRSRWRLTRCAPAPSSSPPAACATPVASNTTCATTSGRPECAIVIIGFQAEGTLGRRLVNGDKHVRLFGEEHAVRASVHTIGGLSAHADRDALLAWLRGFDTPPQRCFVVHGEAATACGFADRIADELGWSVEAPAAGSRVDL
jgi:metallo-beta-lactamase family protein